MVCGSSSTHQYATRPKLLMWEARRNVFKQAGERYRAFDQWERDDLILNLVENLKICKRDIQERMIGHFLRADEEYGKRVAQGLGIDPSTLQLPPIEADARPYKS